MIPPDATVGVDTRMERVWSPEREGDTRELRGGDEKDGGGKRRRLGRKQQAMSRPMQSPPPTPDLSPLTREQVLRVLHDRLKQAHEGLGQMMLQVVLSRGGGQEGLRLGTGFYHMHTPDGKEGCKTERRGARGDLVWKKSGWGGDGTRNRSVHIQASVLLHLSPPPPPPLPARQWAGCAPVRRSGPRPSRRPWHPKHEKGQGQ